jgi:hypothetical protein
MDEFKLLEDLHSGWFATGKTEYNISKCRRLHLLTVNIGRAKF